VALDGDGSGDLVVAAGALDEDLAGVFCFSGTWPSLVFVPGRAVQVGTGAIGAT
jgi:hypothetical protein